MTALKSIIKLLKDNYLVILALIAVVLVLRNKGQFGGEPTAAMPGAGEPANATGMAPGTGSMAVMPSEAPPLKMTFKETTEGGKFIYDGVEYMVDFDFSEAVINQPIYKYMRLKSGSGSCIKLEARTSDIDTKIGLSLNSVARNLRNILKPGTAYSRFFDNRLTNPYVVLLMLWYLDPDMKISNIASNLHQGGDRFVHGTHMIVIQGNVIIFVNTGKVRPGINYQFTNTGNHVLLSRNNLR